MLRARATGQVTIEDDVEPSFEIAGFPGEMSHVFLNVLDNALKAIDDHGTISVKAVVQGGFYEIRIGDSGPGVSEELASRIFEPFFTTRPAGEGTGLGLAIVRQVLERCGGDIRVSRSPLGGAEFTVRIPALKPEPRSLQVSPVATTPGTQSKSPNRQDSAAGHRSP
jgi:signal transduction histidine kinase